MLLSQISLDGQATSCANSDLHNLDYAGQSRALEVRISVVNDPSRRCLADFLDRVRRVRCNVIWTKPLDTTRWIPFPAASRAVVVTSGCGSSGRRSKCLCGLRTVLRPASRSCLHSARMDRRESSCGELGGVCCVWSGHELSRGICHCSGRHGCKYV